MDLANKHSPISACAGMERVLKSAVTTGSPNLITLSDLRDHHETADAYTGVVALLSARHRVVVCKDAIQWILQHRKKEAPSGPGGVLVTTSTREALIRASASLCGRVDPCAMAILAALPDTSEVRYDPQNEVPRPCAATHDRG